MYSNRSACASARVASVVPCTRSFFKLLKKLSVGALSCHCGLGHRWRSLPIINLHKCPPCTHGRKGQKDSVGNGDHENDVDEADVSPRRQHRPQLS